MKLLFTSILAAIFLVSGHFFMVAYADYNINLKKLALLKGQERSVKNRIKEFKNKQTIVEKVNTFIDKAEQNRLTKNSWDKFFVSLKNEPHSFLKLQALLDQTSNCSQYYFKPDSLSIKRGYIKTDSALESGHSQPHGSQTIKQEPTQTSWDTTISLNGYFLVHQRGD